VEGILERYLSIFLPFIATIVLAHLVVRSSGSWQVERTGLASPILLRRILIASGTAIAIIVGVDVLTSGDLFLRPDPLRSPILFGLVVVGLVAANFAWRAFGFVGERLRRD
jgi:hypothetical protein